MKIIYTGTQYRHAPADCLSATGRFLHPEVPERAETILTALRADPNYAVLPPGEPPLDALTEVHAVTYRRFLEEIYSQWTAAGESPDGVIPDLFPGRAGRRHGRHPANQAGWFCSDTFTPILAGTFAAARDALRCALTAADFLMAGDARVYALTRPPGHHAGRDFCGGFCYLNNAAVASAHLCRHTDAARVAILDLDAHHGNGTQEIFYETDQVLTVSIHADPNEAFPYYWGYAEETGAGPGEGFNLNLPLPLESGAPVYWPALHRALERIHKFAPRFLIISLGVDGVAGDPLGHLALAPDAFGRLGREVCALNLPTLVVQEGGYHKSLLGPCVRDFLSGLA